MPDWPPIPLAAFVGFIFALMLSCVPGPINLTILNDGAGEINILTAVGFSVPNTMQPAPGSTLP